MKKNFPLKAPGKADARVIEAIKSDIRKYVKRERRKTPPEGFELWDFNCKVGASAATAEVQPLKEIGRVIDAVAQTGVESVYVEIIAAPGHRTPNSSADVV